MTPEVNSPDLVQRFLARVSIRRRVGNCAHAQHFPTALVEGLSLVKVKFILLSNTQP